ncbi:pyrimidine reductase family protein [Streptomyces kanamyceticus]|uniref:Pyrimidine reductase family protein n=1 Tax=Streptomyces kanamyceticus TaxID=1967 RepID=A0A5J6G957_STRKN|nr:pyrimidine reductase family protein [Streptomyces kanamyceticus]QEU91142.1 pyrimidine reductase family protein [Streptomyces kanamyceticus]
MRRLFPVTDQTCDRKDARTEDRTPDRAHDRTDDRAEGAHGTDSAPGVGGAAGAAGRAWGLDELADAYAYPGGGAPWLRANMVSTLDGAAQHDGRSQPISNDTDMRIFGTLRGLADVVIVGAQTVRQEGYRPTRAREAFAARRAAAGQTAAPAVAVVSAGLDLDFTLPLFTAPLAPTLVVTGAAAPADRMAEARKAGAVVVIAGEGAAVAPERVAPALAERGLTRLLTEGGPRLLGQFVAAGVLDELCLTISPMLTAGDAQRIAGGPSVSVPEKFVLTSVLEEAGFLFTRYRRT